MDGVEVRVAAVEEFGRLPVVLDPGGWVAALRRLPLRAATWWWQGWLVVGAMRGRSGER